jgi:Dyp-type peroxidase family
VQRKLDLADIQGNIVRPYGRYGFPITRHMFFNIGNAAAGRSFIDKLRGHVTTSERWRGVDDNAGKDAPPRPLVCINVGFSFLGLLALELPTRTLGNMPEEFIDGMAQRWSIIGDFGSSAPDRWDPIWCDARATPDKQIHIWVALNAPAKPDGSPIDELTTRTEWLRGIAAESGGVTLLTGHKGPNPAWQEASAIMVDDPDGPPGTKVPIAKEHFGFTDGIADPAFAGQYEPAEEAMEVIGGGKFLPGGKDWSALATGEFILGHVSEAQELPPTAPPWSFVRNGTFMALRKLHQNVGSFHDYINAQAEQFHRVGGASSVEAANETLRAKMVGRWANGIPLAVAATFEESQAIAEQWKDIPAILRKGPNRTKAEQARQLAFEILITNFRYAGDEQGARCPVSAHIRRANPRDVLDPTFGTANAKPGSALSNRRRILRRGAPYGDSSQGDNDSEHGVIFMAICGSLFRQFEFVQQQWVQYGASFNVGNDTDPLIGGHGDGAKFVIPTDPAKDGVPFVCANIPQFVETRGGEYFFLPSLTALREIAQGSVDPT